MKEKKYTAKVSTVNKALDLLRLRQSSQGAKRYKKISATLDDRTVFHCSNSKMRSGKNCKRKKVTSSAFTRSLVALEMRKCFMRHDWSHAVDLLPLLLNGRSDTEPLVWRYLVTELLYNPNSTLAKFNNFLQLCVNGKSSEFLKQILTISCQTDDSDST